MLNWKLEEDILVSKKSSEYYEKLGWFYKEITSKRKLDKEMENVRKDIKLKYRAEKLNTFDNEIKKERNRINELVNKINFEFNDFIRKNKGLIDNNIVPFKIKVKPYNTCNEEILCPGTLEHVTIYFEPMAISFLQERLNSDE